MPSNVSEQRVSRTVNGAADSGNAVSGRAVGDSVSVIIPFHRRLTQLGRSLAAVRTSMPSAEVVLAADGAVEDCQELADAHGATVVVIDGPLGPAVARNRAAEAATGDILVFVDTDVVVAPDAIPRLCTYLARRPEVAGVFGAYDEDPGEDNFMSRYKNLSHSYIHQHARGDALTFWAGLGAVRAAAFRSVGGFNEGIRRPSVEDIELGYRLIGAGHRLGVEPAARGCHLKRWTLWGSLVTDVRDRGIPWTQLILRHRALADDLNTKGALRWSVVLSYVFLCSIVGAWMAPPLAILAAAALAGVVALNLPYYRWFWDREGSWFAVRVIAAHVLHHLCNGVSVVAGALLHAADRVGLHPPGRIPEAHRQ
jgi:glycosyltransferase involved in cell wall biosynthesis